MDYRKILSDAGKRGGEARAKNLSREQLRRIALKGVRARLQKKIKIGS